MRKQVIIHAGFPKTGSSALQLFFSENVKALAAAGVDYPCPDVVSVARGGGGTGNLVEILNRYGFIDEFRSHAGGVRVSAVRAVTREYWQRVERLVSASERERVLLSGEFVGNQSAEQLAAMRDALIENHDVHIIAFVRDPFDVAVSAWKQHVKTNVQRRTFADYIDSIRLRKKTLGMFRCFENAASLPCRLSILNYDTFKKDLVAALLDRAEIGVSGSTSRLRDDNRSLTDSEAAVLALVNIMFAGTTLPKRLADRMLRREPTQRGRFYSREAHQAILDARPDILARINESIIGGPLRTTVRDTTDSPVEVQPGDVELLAAILSTSDHGQRKARPPSRMRRVARRLVTFALRTTH